MPDEVILEYTLTNAERGGGDITVSLSVPGYVIRYANARGGGTITQRKDGGYIYTDSKGNVEDIPTPSANTNK